MILGGVGKLVFTAIIYDKVEKEIVTQEFSDDIDAEDFCKTYSESAEWIVICGPVISAGSHSRI